MDDKWGNESRNHINNSGHSGASMSGGSMNNPMYREVHSSGGVYQRVSARCDRRIAAKRRGESSCNHKKFWEL